MSYALGLASLIKIKNKLSKTFCKWEDPQKKRTLWKTILGTQKNLITNNTLKTMKKPETSMEDH